MVDYSAHTPARVLLMEPLDPTGATFLLADSISCAHLGCHALSVVTALHSQDTLDVETIHVVDAEIIHDQARCLLEDIAIQAIKAGPIYTADCASVLTQLATDYHHVPLVLHLPALPDERCFESEIALDESVAALCQLVIPQATVVVTSRTVLEQWQEAEYLPDAPTAVRALLAAGAAAAVCATPASDGQAAVYEYHTAEQDVQRWPIPKRAPRLQDVEGTLACAIAALLAQQHTLDDAIQQALNFTEQLAQRPIALGMGLLTLDQSR